MVMFGISDAGLSYLFARMCWLLNLSNTNYHLEYAVRVINDSALTRSGGETLMPNILQAGNYSNPQMHIE